MDLRSSSMNADILNVLLDSKVHTLQEIAEIVEVSRKTVYRHIQSLSYKFPVETFHGGDKRGGVYLDAKYIVNGKIITNDKLQLIGKALDLLQKSDAQDVNQELLCELIRDFAPPTIQKEQEMEL